MGGRSDRERESVRLKRHFGNARFICLPLRDPNETSSSFTPLFPSCTVLLLSPSLSSLSSLSAVLTDVIIPLSLSHSLRITFLLISPLLRCPRHREERRELPISRRKNICPVCRRRCSTTRIQGFSGNHKPSWAHKSGTVTLDSNLCASFRS